MLSSEKKNGGQIDRRFCIKVRLLFTPRCAVGAIF